MGRPATLKVDIIADARRVGSGVAEAEGKLGRLGKAGKAVGKAAAAGLAAAGVAAGAFALSAVKSASRVEQSYGALETIYGKSAAKVKAWSKTAADSVGLAASEYAELSSLVGSQLQNMGMAQDASAKRSDKLIKLGSDLAATYGGTVADAVGAVSSLMKGEADPIERYGVSIKAADVSARLASQGLDNLTGKAQKQAQANALLSLLNEQTAKTTGAFARESNTLAGQQERLKAKFENVKATVGAKLLPVVTKLVTWLSEKLLPAAARLGGWLQQKLGPAFASVGKWITTKLVPAGREFVRWFLDKIVPGIKQYLTPILAGAKSAFARVSEAVERNEKPLGRLVAAIKKVAEFAAKYILPIVGKAIGAAFKVMGGAISDAIDIISRLVGWFDSAISKVRSLIDWIGNIKMPSLGSLGKLVTGAVGNLTTVGVSLVGQAPSYDGRHGYSTASATGAAWSLFNAGPSLPAGQVVVVDRRDLSTTVQLPADPLGLVDEAALARRLQRILDRHAVRIGQASTVGAR